MNRYFFLETETSTGSTESTDEYTGSTIESTTGILLNILFGVSFLKFYLNKLKPVHSV